MYQFFLPIDKKAQHGFLDRRYFSQVAIQHTSKMFFSIERVHPLSAWKEKWCLSLDQKSAKFSRSAAETGGASFQPSSGYSSKLWVSPEWLTLGMIGGYKRNQYVLNICRTKNTVNSIIKCEEWTSMSNCEIDPSEILKPGFHFSESYELKIVLVKVFVWIIFHLINCSIFLYWISKNMSNKHRLFDCIINKDKTFL